MPDGGQASVDPRVAIVNEHVRLENSHDFPACLAVFDHARYEIIPTGEMYDGPEAVDGFLSQNRKAFPDFVFVPTRVVGAENGVLVEGRFTGTHNGTWRGLPPTGRHVDFPMCIIFDFEGERMVLERVYFDLGAPLQQLGVGDDPNKLRGKLTIVLTHPFVIFKAFVRGVVRKITHRKG